jgi:hypothetical protein
MSCVGVSAWIGRPQERADADERERDYGNAEASSGMFRRDDSVWRCPVDSSDGMSCVGVSPWIGRPQERADRRDADERDYGNAEASSGMFRRGDSVMRRCSGVLCVGVSGCIGRPEERADRAVPVPGAEEADLEDKLEASSWVEPLRASPCPIAVSVSPVTLSLVSFV